jgi:dehydrogenase/reductase SDR family protein 1
MSTVNLKDKVCVVTGATRGIGRGIALQLGSAGAKVYLTGRTEELLRQVAQEIKARGGTPVPVVLDHSNDQEVKDFFSKLPTLDALVNNAFAGVGSLHSAIGKSFWKLDPIEQWDSINGVGLRGHYLCTVYASR